MKVLMIFSYAPLPPPLDLGGTKRNLPFLLENLKRHETSVLSYGTPEEERIFMQTIGKLCKSVTFVNKRRPRIVNGLQKLWLLATGRSPYRQMYRRTMQQALDAMVAKEQFDVIHTSVIMLGYLRFPRRIPVVSDTHEVTYDLLHRIYKSDPNMFWKPITYLAYKFGKREEIKLCNSFDAVIATTERDSQVFQQDVPKEKLFVVQNGAGSEFFEPLDVKQEPHSMVFTGLMTHYPNNHGVLYFLDEIFPRILEQTPDARVYIVGKSPSKQVLARACDHIVVTGFVDDVKPWIARGQVYIIPLLVGGGIRGKALEAMAMKRPIVTTSIGVEGIHLKNEESALFADSPEQFAESVVRLFNDGDLRHRIAEKAYMTAVARYQWDAKGKELDAVYRAVVSKRARAPRQMAEQGILELELQGKV